jgi:putative heme degradation protein
MKPGIEAAWIAASGGFLGVLVGVTGTAIVARLGFRNTRDATNVTTAATMATVEAQIEADRQSRIWEKRADIYTDFLAVIKRRQESRRNAMQGMINARPLRWSPRPGPAR